jgi:elongation factor P--(R)-beta-lysine ligase
MQQGADHSDFLPTASWPNLRLRAELLARTRAFFQDRAFLEVETPLLSADVVVDRHIDPLSVILPHDPRKPAEGRTLWLQTSPEFAMKRLMAAGGEAVYQITRAFRGGESGRLHNPEFTIVEWYRRGDSMEDGMQLTADLCESLLNLGPAERVSYAQAFETHVGIDPHRTTAAELAEVARAQGLAFSDSLAAGDRDAWLNLLLAELVQPHLGQPRPTLLYHYPGSQAALARVAGDPPLAERFELFVRGVELANGYHELLDAEVLRGRNRQANDERAAEGKPRLPAGSRLLEAMDVGLPACGGTALGFDRLVMVAAGAQSLADVVAFPIDRA